MLITTEIIAKPQGHIIENIPCFFKNSCPANNAFTENKHEHAADDTSEVATDGPSTGSPLMVSNEKDYQANRPAALGGFTLCAPGCLSNIKETVIYRFMIFQMGRVKISSS